jgi:uncharacterized protein (TIGR00297 family)
VLQSARLRALVSVGLAGLVAGAGWRRGALSADGALAATAVGAATFGAGGLDAGLGLIAFFVTGSALSRRKMVAGEVESSKGHRRDAAQVFANGGVAALAALLGARGSSRARGATIGALAAAAADTWASEIGVRSPTPPRSIVTCQVVPPGTSGGTTPLGWAAAAAGALVVGATIAVVGRDARSVGAILARSLAGGLVGTLVDSLAGATLQAAYRCPVCGTPAESPGMHCGEPRLLVRGSSVITNDAVNLLGTVSGALVGAML